LNRPRPDPSMGGFGLWLSRKWSTGTSDLFARRIPTYAWPGRSGQRPSRTRSRHGQTPDVRRILFGQIDTILSSQRHRFNVKWDQQPAADRAATGSDSRFMRCSATWCAARSGRGFSRAAACGPAAACDFFGVLGTGSRVRLSIRNDALDAAEDAARGQPLIAPQFRVSHVGPRHCHYFQVGCCRCRSGPGGSQRPIMGFEMESVRELTPMKPRRCARVTAWWKQTRGFLFLEPCIVWKVTTKKCLPEMTVDSDANGYLFAGTGGRIAADFPTTLRAARS